MLKSLTVKNFVIVRHAQLEFEQGMSVITGETGAGKSILIEALIIVLGQRAPNRLIPQDKKLSVSLSFDLSKNSTAKKWLTAHNLDSEDDCILQRIIESGARSHAYINGIPVTLNQLKKLGGMLVDIVGQNAHQQLLQPKKHLEILDLHCGNQTLTKELHKLWQKWTSLSQQIEKCQTQQEKTTGYIDLLRYQVKELEEFSPEQDEFEQIEKEHIRLAQIEQLRKQTEQAYNTLYKADEHSIYAQIAQISGKLESFSTADENLAKVRIELETAMECIQNANDEMKICLEKSLVSNEEFDKIERRLSGYIELSRKHKTAPGQIAKHYQKLNEELNRIENPECDIEGLKQKRTACAETYNQLALKIRQRRHEGVNALEREINQLLNRLNMPMVRFAVRFKKCDGTPKAEGLDNVEFMVRTNPGQPLAPVRKVASGGELSRISLAIQVAFAKNHPIPTLVFDEVDAGIGGKTAEMIGKLLRRLGCKTQVLCITHLPQIATFANHHYFVKKQSYASATTVDIRKLSTTEERKQEIARMLAGTKITDRTLAHAKEMLALSTPAQPSTDINAND